MRKEPGALVPPRRFAVERGLILRAAELGHGAGDSVIEALVELPEFVGADGRRGFDREFGDGLAHITVVVHDLRGGESFERQLVPMLQRRPGDVHGRAAVTATQRVAELVEEDRDAMRDLTGGWRGDCASGHLRAAPADDLVTVQGDKFMQHRVLSRG